MDKVTVMMAKIKPRLNNNHGINTEANPRITL